MRYSDRHPRTSELLLSHLAKQSLILLVLEYCALLFVLSVAVAAFDHRAFGLSTESQALFDFLEVCFAYFLYIFGGQPEVSPDSEIWAVVRTLLHTFFLGGLVFKLLLTKGAFIFRKTFATYFDIKADTWMTAFRLYNASNLEIREVAFTAYLRVPLMRQDGRVIRNINLQIESPKNKWHFALPFVPYTVRLKLSPGDVALEHDGPRLSALHGTPITPENFDTEGHSFLVLCADALNPHTGLCISESKWYCLTDDTKREISWGQPSSVETLPGKVPKQTGGNPRSWKGWANFEWNRRATPEGFVFVYGSLIDPHDFWQLLSGYRLSHLKPKWHRLEGYRLAWNVAMRNRDTIPTYKYYVEPGSASDESSGASHRGRAEQDYSGRPDVYVTYLNIEEDQHSYVEGLVLPVNNSMQKHLDQRERNYNRQIIVPDFDGLGLPLWAYIGSKNGRDRFEEGKERGKAVIARSYFDKVKAAYAAHGKARLENFNRAQTRLTIHELELRRLP